MPETIIAGNWKMNTTLDEAQALVHAMKSGLDEVKGLRKVVCPPFVSLAAVSSLLKGSTIEVGAQNMHFEKSGAFTGEVSSAMLAGLCKYVVLGHSERRHIFGEADDLVGRKVKAAMAAGLSPILCVGEQLAEREQGRAEAVVERQLRAGLDGITTPRGLVVAYEPVWAIGTGKAATPQDAQQMMAHIRRVLTALQGQAIAANTPFLYGGSVNAENVATFVREPDVNGALVGGASLKADIFVQLARNAAAVRA